MASGEQRDSDAEGWPRESQPLVMDRDAPFAAEGAS